MSLSRREEQVLLAIWALEDNAYLISIKNFLTDQTGKEWSIGPVQKPILQLEKKGYITTFMGEPSNKRGGKRKKMCKITDIGVEALKILKREQDKIWRDFIKIECD